MVLGVGRMDGKEELGGVGGLLAQRGGRAGMRSVPRPLGPNSGHTGYLELHLLNSRRRSDKPIGVAGPSPWARAQVCPRPREALEAT